MSTAWMPPDESPTTDGMYQRLYWDGTIALAHWRGGRWVVVSLWGGEVPLPGGLPWRGVTTAAGAATKGTDAAA